MESSLYPAMTAPEQPPSVPPEGGAAPDATSAPTAAFTIDELAAASKVPSRTIRFWQSKGLLPRPEVRGRVAYYGDAHVERLRLVQELQDRGLQIRAISDVVARLDKGELALGEWLGLEDQLAQSWAGDAPKLLDARELQELSGDDRPGRIAELVRVGLVERKGDRFLVSSPALLQIAARLEAGGIDVQTLLEASQLLRKHLSRAAHDALEFFLARADDLIAEGKSATAIADAIRVLRPSAMDALRVIFAQELEREIRRAIESGRTAKLTAKRKR
jgi:DNA-binding transcriptional MerR regulator